MKVGRFWCKTCINLNLEAEARSRGCVLLGEGRTSRSRVFQLECGHPQEITLQHMRLGNFRCHECEGYFYTLPSQAYLLHIKVGADECLKPGYAKDVDFRATRYGLPSEADVAVVATKPFDTGKEARNFEGALHKKYRRKRLRRREMQEFHISGATECYPVKMVEKLMREFRLPQ